MSFAKWRSHKIGMPIFIVKNNPSLANPIKLDKDDEHHLLRVMRMKPGSRVTLTDNQGTLALACLDHISPVVLTRLSTSQQPPPPPLVVCLPLIEQRHMEWAVEKITELNAGTIQLITTARCQQQTLSARKMNRLEKVALAAQKQSERAWPLQILDPVPLKKLLVAKKIIVVGTLSKNGQPFSQEALIDRQPIFCLVGPEGGFTSEETNLLEKAKAFTINLGPTVLRSETAAMAITSITQFLIFLQH